MSDRLRIVQVGDVALVAPALTGALGASVDMVAVPLRQPAARRAWPLKALGLPLRLAEATRVATRVRAARPDVVHIHWVPNGLVGLLAGRPWVLHAHGDDMRSLNRWRRAAFGPLMRAADALIVSTPDLLADAPRAAEWVPTPITPFDHQETPRWDVLVNAAAWPSKGPATAFAALRELARRRPSLRLAAHDGPEFEEGPWERLRRIDKTAYRERQAAARVVLGQFVVGALGIADLEAMAAGRPLLTWLRDGLYSDPPPVFSSQNAADLASRAIELLDDQEQARALGETAREWVARTHDPQMVAAQLLTIYRRVAP